MKGQSSVEMVLLIGITLFLFSIIIYTGLTYLNHLKTTLSLKILRHDVNVLCYYVDRVNTYGDGTTTQTMIYLPEGYNPTNSYIKNNRISFSLSDSVVDCMTSVPVVGNPPDTSGKHMAYITKKDGKVSITFDREIE